MFPAVSSSEDTETEELSRQTARIQRRRRRRARAAHIYRVAQQQQREEEGERESSTRSPSPAWVVPSPPSSPPPQSPTWTPISPIRISSDDDGREEPTAAPTPSMEVTEEATATPQLKIHLSEVNLLKNQVFMEGAKCPICMEGHCEDAVECLYRCSSCNTDYHGTCLLSWTTNAGTCPACRAVENIDCIFAKIKNVMPHMTISGMIDHILNSATNEELSELNNRVAAKLLYHENGDDVPFWHPNHHSDN